MKFMRAKGYWKDVLGRVKVGQSVYTSNAPEARVAAVAFRRMNKNSSREKVGDRYKVTRII